MLCSLPLLANTLPLSRPGLPQSRPQKTRSTNWDETVGFHAAFSIRHKTWRWAIIFKKNDQPVGGAEINGGDRLSHIELINNCTTTTGFELKVTMNGRSYHGGIRVDRAFRDFYRQLSELQAGSVPLQTAELTKGDSKYSGQSRVFGFGDTSIYGGSKGWGPNSASLTPGKTLRIDLERYRSLAATDEISVEFSNSNIDRGTILFERYGSDSPYFEKPKIRGLLHSVRKSAGSSEEKELPRFYSDIEQWTELNLPNFETKGFYNHGSLVSVRGHCWLYEIDECILRHVDSGTQEKEKFEVEFRRTAEPDLFQLRRIVLGNLDLEGILNSPTPLTIDRFGYAARPTVMDYDAMFRPATDPGRPGTYAFLLAGPDDDRGYSDYFVCPESFGVERAILSGSASNRTLTVELASFERILFLWRVTFRLPKLDLGSEGGV